MERVYPNMVERRFPERSSRIICIRPKASDYGSVPARLQQSTTPHRGIQSLKWPGRFTDTVRYMSSPAISVSDLCVNYRDKSSKLVSAVRGLSFEIQRGEVVGFLGPNGAGKSSTLKALMGFVRPTSGECTIFDLPAGSLEAKKRTGYLPEVAMYYPFLTPIETLTLYGELQGLRGRALRDEAIELLVELGIERAMRKQNRQLSKGMLQRVGIAQALLGRPELLILDEVTSGLDPVGRRELRSVLRQRQHDGCTLFFSSHELSEVEMLCDRILLIDNGVLIDERIVAPLKEELRTYAICYRGEALMVDLTDDWVDRSGIRTASFHRRDQLIQAISRVHSCGGEILDVTAQDGSLEEYFVQTIGRAA